MRVEYETRDNHLDARSYHLVVNEGLDLNEKKRNGSGEGSYLVMLFFEIGGSCLGLG